MIRISMEAHNLTQKILFVVESFNTHTRGVILHKIPHRYNALQHPQIVCQQQSWVLLFYLCIAFSCLCNDRLVLNYEEQCGQEYGFVSIWAASICRWMSRLSLLYFSQNRQLQYLTPSSTRQKVCSSMYKATLSCSTKTESNESGLYFEVVFWFKEIG